MMNQMEKLSGTIRVECTPKLKSEIKKSGTEGCFLVMDEIRSINGVVDVWSTDDQKIDLLVEIAVDTYEQGREIESKIKNIDGVLDAHAYIEVEV